MLTQLLILLGLCYQVDVSNPKITTTLVCEHNNHSLVVWFYKDGSREAWLDGADLLIPNEERKMCKDENGENHVYR